MKYLFLLLATVFVAGRTAAQDNGTSTSTTTGNVPTELVTDAQEPWTISTISTINYVNTTPGPSYNTYRNGGGMLVKFRFKKNNRFEFQLYVLANSYGTTSEAWTETEGTVEFTRDAKGQAIFITHAEKGTYRTNQNGKLSSRAIPKDELEGKHSTTYLWERTRFADDPRHIYLLLVDLEAHPGVDVNDPKTISPDWVSRFHIPVKP